ncbi:MAG: histidine phosphatase family protein [Candidatus Thorarchaeota archaeon]|jgi:broad specificity phosphatase PhoE
MFDLVQEGDIGPGLAARTMVYVITNGETDVEKLDRLTDLGKNQVVELARSRVATGLQVIYYASNDVTTETAKILSDEFKIEAKKKDCFHDVTVGKGNPNAEQLAKTLPDLWNDVDFAPNKGESLMMARRRLADCVRGLIGRHRGNSIALILSTTMSVLFYTLVRGGEPNLDEWLETGHASCAAYEYAKDGWTLVMPPDNSFLVDGNTVRDTLPDEVKDSLGIR